ncbi:hypothetical protein Fot_06462 [Forsythia ovata]|uniref:Uncharacterized protein n=1 Tax=Forsythia ovata TaxID=205694 RepID=A0ABD1WW02_9LAMI
MVRARDSQAQQRYNHGIQVNAKSLDKVTRHQVWHRQGSHLCLFPRIRSSYTAKIMETIPNLHAWLNTHNQDVLMGESGPTMSKKPFTRPYCTHHWFYGHRTED